MYEVNVKIHEEGKGDIKFNQYCADEELELLIKYYKDISYQKIDEGMYSLSRETVFCPYCLTMEFVKVKKKIYVCRECGKKFFIK